MKTIIIVLLLLQEGGLDLGFRSVLRENLEQGIQVQLRELLVGLVLEGGLVLVVATALDVEGVALYLLRQLLLV